MPTHMLLNIQPDEERVAIIEDSVLTNLEIETSASRTLKGNIYKGVLRKVEPSLQACFVDYGTVKNGFLPRSEIHPNLYGGRAGPPPPVQEVFKDGQEVMVQVVRDAVGSKGVTFTTLITLAGRYLVLVPDNDRVAVSRKLPPDERARFRELANSLTLPEGYGLIFRTAAEDQKNKDILADFEYLKRLYAAIGDRYNRKRGVGLLYREADLALRFIRDYLTSDVDVVYIDDDETYDSVRTFMTHVMPDGLGRLKRYTSGVPMFEKHGIEEEVERTFARKVPLPSGGAIVIDPTEALVAIDVNSGRIKEKDIEDTAFRTNLEACRVIAQQMIIRDLGGLVVIDFIDMRESARRREVEKALRQAMGQDKAHYRIGRISQFGLLELTRQRLRSTSLENTFEQCRHCGGRGLLRTATSAAMKLLRQIQGAAAGKRANVIRARVPVEVANFLLNRRRRFMASLEEHYRCHIDIQADPSLDLTDVTIEYVSMPREDLPVDREIIVVEHHDLIEETRVETREESAVAEPPQAEDELPSVVEGWREGSLDVTDEASSGEQNGDLKPISSWFRKLFGGSERPAEPEPASESAPAAAEAAPAEAPIVRSTRTVGEEELLAVEDLDVSVVVEAAPPPPPVSTGDGASEDAEERRGTRRRSRPRRRSASRSPVVGGSLRIAEAASKSAEKQAAETPTRDAGSEGEEEPTKKKRRRRRRRRKPAAASEETAEQSAATEPAEDGGSDKDKDKAEPAPKKRTRSRKSAKPSDETSPAAKDGDAPEGGEARKESAPEAGGDGDEVAAPKRPPRKRTRKRSPQKKTENADSEPAARRSKPAPQAPPSPPLPPAPPSKPWAPVIDLRSPGGGGE